ncbi:MAG: hypothetical protein K940chlam3_00316 [Chlamydiae bacterium]|nr:hypothetical protein [Chlamydiota bacterium]
MDFNIADLILKNLQFKPFFDKKLELPSGKVDKLTSKAWKNSCSSGPVTSTKRTKLSHLEPMSVQSLINEIWENPANISTVVSKLESHERLKKALVMEMLDKDGYYELLKFHASHLLRFKDERKREDLGRLLTKSGRGTLLLMRNFEVFGFNRSFKFELVEILYHDRDYFHLLSQYIEEFECPDIELRKKIALLASLDGTFQHYLSKNIDKFGIDDIEFIKMIAQNIIEIQPSKVLYNIDKFGFDRATNIELAFQFVETERTAYELASHIDQFGFEGTDILLELANKILEYPSGGRELVQHFDQFGITCPRFKKKIADKILQELRSSVTPWIEDVINHIHRLDLHPATPMGQKFLIEMACDIAAHQLVSAGEIYRNIDIFDIQNPHVIKSLKSNYKLYHDYYTKEKFLSIMIKPLMKWSEVNQDINEKIEILRQIPVEDDEKIKLLSACDIVQKYFSFAEEDRPNLATFNQAFNVIFGSLRKNKGSISVSLKDLQKIRAFVERYDSLLKCIDDLSKIDGELRSKLSVWLYYTIMKITFLITDPKLRNEVFKSRIIRSLFNLRDHELRYVMVNKFLRQLQDRPKASRREFLREITKSSRSSLTKLALNGLEQKLLEEESETAEVEEIQSFRETFKNPTKKDRATRKIYRNMFQRDGVKLCALLSALYQLEKSSNMEKGQICTLLRYLMQLEDNKKKHELFAELNVLNALFLIGKEGSIVVDSSSENHKQMLSILVRQFGELLPGLAVENPDKINELFFSGRHPEALPVYAAGLQDLGEEDKEIVLSSLRDFVQDVVSGEFNEKRYENSLHLSEVFKKEGLKEEWKAGQIGPLSAYLPKNASEKKFDPKEFIELRIRDGHLPINSLPRLASLLSIPITKETSVNESLDALLVGLVKNPDSLSPELINEIEEAVRQIKSDHEFLNDIDVLRDVLKPPAKKKEDDLIIVDSDHYLDLFLCGTEVAGSCQRVNGFSKYNKALMGYVQDGKHRVLAIKDSTGRIIGRSILRLLLNEKNEPVLFFERVYPTNLSFQYQRALQNFATERAQKMGIDLISSIPNSSLELYGVVKSLSLKAPYEYCDARYGIHDGPYEISYCYRLS